MCDTVSSMAEDEKYYVYEGMDTAANQIIVTVMDRVPVDDEPVDPTKVKDYEIHKVPPVEKGEKVHEASSTCHCLPKITMQTPDGDQHVFWTIEHKSTPVAK